MSCIETFCVTVLGLIVPDFAINDSPVWSAGKAGCGKSKSVLSETVFFSTLLFPAIVKHLGKGLPTPRSQLSVNMLVRINT